MASSSCRRPRDCGVDTGTHNRAPPLPEREHSLSAGAPGTTKSSKGFWRQDPFPSHSLPGCLRTPMDVRAAARQLPSSRAPSKLGATSSPRAGSVLTSLAPLQELRCLQQDLDVASHGFHVGGSRRRAG